jgi:acyl-CoA-binding protein
LAKYQTASYFKEFQQAAIDVKEKLKVKPSDADLLELYALYKQGTVGNCTGGLSI